jgi:hypothetical protein
MSPGFQVVTSDRYLATWDLKRLANYINENYRAKNAAKFVAVGTLVSFQSRYVVGPR